MPAETSYLHNKRLDECFEDTRVDVLATIKTWVERTGDCRHRMLWLSGMAALGKSVIFDLDCRVGQDEGNAMQQLFLLS